MIFKTTYIYFVTRAKRLPYRFNYRRFVHGGKRVVMQIGIYHTYGRCWSRLNNYLESLLYMCKIGENTMQFLKLQFCIELNRINDMNSILRYSFVQFYFVVHPEGWWPMDSTTYCSSSWEAGGCSIARWGRCRHIPEDYWWKHTHTNCGS